MGDGGLVRNVCHEWVQQMSFEKLKINYEYFLVPHELICCAIGLWSEPSMMTPLSPSYLL